MKFHSEQFDVMMYWTVSLKINYVSFLQSLVAYNMYKSKSAFHVIGFRKGLELIHFRLQCNFILGSLKEN
jgi:hypothetical protein